MRNRDSENEDYLLRIIRQAAEALRLLRHRLMGTADSPDAIRIQASATIDALLGSQAAILGRLDPVSAARLAGHPEVVALWASLLDVEADALAAMGDEDTAARRRARAVELREAVKGEA